MFNRSPQQALFGLHAQHPSTELLKALDASADSENPVANSVGLKAVFNYMRFLGHIQKLQPVVIIELYTYAMRKMSQKDGFQGQELTLGEARAIAHTSNMAGALLAIATTYDRIEFKTKPTSANGGVVSKTIKHRGRKITDERTLKVTRAIVLDTVVPDTFSEGGSNAETVALSTLFTNELAQITQDAKAHTSAIIALREKLSEMSATELRRNTQRRVQEAARGGRNGNAPRPTCPIYYTAASQHDLDFRIPLSTSHLLASSPGTSRPTAQRNVSFREPGQVTMHHSITSLMGRPFFDKFFVEARAAVPASDKPSLMVVDGSTGLTIPVEEPTQLGDVLKARSSVTVSMNDLEQTPGGRIYDISTPFEIEVYNHHKYYQYVFNYSPFDEKDANFETYISKYPQAKKLYDRFRGELARHVV